MNKNELRITDNVDRTVDIIKCIDEKFQIIMFEASTDYHQNAWFATRQEAIIFSEKWVFKK